MKLISNFNINELYFFTYLLFINLFSFMLFGLDKSRAEKRLWRISESFLIGVSILGGSIGSLMGMVVYKHKLSKKKFYVGIPCILLLNKIIELGILNYIKK